MIHLVLVFIHRFFDSSLALACPPKKTTQIILVKPRWIYHESHAKLAAINKQVEDVAYWPTPWGIGPKNEDMPMERNWIFMRSQDVAAKITSALPTEGRWI
jgi:hypothetical protein